MSDGAAGLLRAMLEGGTKGGRFSCFECARSVVSEILYSEYAVSCAGIAAYHAARFRPEADLPPDPSAFPDLSPLDLGRLPRAAGKAKSGFRRRRRARSLAERGALAPYLFMDLRVGPKTEYWTRQTFYPDGGGHGTHRAVAGAVVGFQRMRDFRDPKGPIPGGPSAAGRLAERLAGKIRTPTAEEVLAGSRARWLMKLALVYEEDGPHGSTKEYAAPDYRLEIPVLETGRAEPLGAPGTLPTVFCPHAPEEVEPGMPCGPTDGEKEEILGGDGSALHLALFSFCCLKAALETPLARVEASGEDLRHQRYHGEVVARGYRFSARSQGGDLFGLLDRAGGAKTDGIGRALGRCGAALSGRPRADRAKEDEA